MIDKGKITDFGGSSVNHSREIPPSMLGRIYLETKLDEHLPYDGWVAGMSLRSFEPPLELDPVCLYDRWGRIVKQWPDNYIPSLTEIRETVEEILLYL